MKVHCPKCCKTLSVGLAHRSGLHEEYEAWRTLAGKCTLKDCAAEKGMAKLQRGVDAALRADFEELGAQ